MRILSNQTIGVAIDFQERLFPHIFQNEELTQNVIKLVSGLKILNIPILVTQQYTKGLGKTIEPIANVLGNYKTIEKSSFSCCDEPDFMHELKNQQRKQVLVFGIEAHVCVLQTTLDLLAEGYQPIVVEDCISSRSLYNKQVAVERMRWEGAIISTCESMLFELLRYSNVAEFKRISTIVK